MQNISWILPEKPCWLDSNDTEYPHECFIQGEIRSLPTQSLKLMVSYKSPNGPKFLEIPTAKVFELNEDIPPQGVDDMVDLPCFNEPEILRNLTNRYKKDIIFTFIGETLLIINPYKTLPCDFSAETIQGYKKYTRQSEKFILKERPPHIFSTAGLAYRQTLEQRRNQAIVISGESGAGKTETVKYTMKFLAELSASDGQKMLSFS